MGLLIMMRIMTILIVTNVLALPSPPAFLPSLSRVKLSPISGFCPCFALNPSHCAGFGSKVTSLTIHTKVAHPQLLLMTLSFGFFVIFFSSILKFPYLEEQPSSVLFTPVFWGQKHCLARGQWSRLFAE